MDLTELAQIRIQEKTAVDYQERLLPQEILEGKQAARRAAREALA
jgi:hypothetical protein